MQRDLIFAGLFMVAMTCLSGCTATKPTHTAPNCTQSAFTNVPGTTKGVITDILTHQRPDTATQLVAEDRHILIPEPGPGTFWSFEKGELTASTKIRGDSMITAKPYADMLLHVEFNCNDRTDTSVENNGNSGVYIQQRYEVQIQNAFGIPKEQFNKSYGGSIYRMKMPDQLVSKPAGQWQTYDIVFRAARFEGVTKTENARITVYHNGVLIHDDVELPRQTGAGMKEGPEPRPLRLQGHNNPVRFRNVWIQELDLK